MAISIGAAIYIGVKPLTKVFLNSSLGFLLARKKILTMETCQNISIILVNVLTPCLIFNKVLLSIDTSDIAAIGVMILTSSLYVCIGLIFACIVKVLTPNPKYWLGGLLVAGMFTNSGDLPVAYITSITNGSAFSADDSAKGIAYCTIFMATLSFFLYNLGAYNLVARDFRKMKHDLDHGSMHDTCEPGYKTLLERRKNIIPDVEHTSPRNSDDVALPSFNIAEPTVFSEKPSGRLSNDSMSSKRSLEIVMTFRSDIPQLVEEPSVSRIEQFFAKYRISFLWALIKNFARPPSFSLLIALFCTLIPPIRKLFYIGDNSIESLGAINIPPAPDGEPILAFIMDFTSFVGAAAVPFGLFMLGATVGQLKVKSIPTGFWKSALLMAIFKLAVLPIISIAWTGKMTSLGWINPADKMAQLVIIFNSGVPTPTMIVYLTAIYRPKDAESCQQMDCVAIYLILQYIILVFTMTILLTYTITSVIHL